MGLLKKGLGFLLIFSGITVMMSELFINYFLVKVLVFVICFIGADLLIGGNKDDEESSIFDMDSEKA